MRFFCAAVLSLVLCGPALAAEKPKFELFFGNKWPGCEYFGKNDLGKIYDAFGAEVPMTLSPFVFENGAGKIVNFAGAECFDEPSPCVLEQLSQCVIEVSNNDQTKYVPWLVCMDTDGETKGDAKTCATKVGVDYSQVSTCQTTRGQQILQQLVKQDASVNSTPTVKVNGKTVGAQQGPDFANVKAALCAADPSLKGCSVTTTEAALVV